MNEGLPERVRKLSQWVLYHDAWIELSDLFESRGNTIEGAHADAARSIKAQLQDGTLRSKTLVHDEFVLRFVAPSLGRAWELGQGGEIPREFWFHYFNTHGRLYEEYGRGIYHPLGEGDEANCGESTFWFVSRQGWKEAGYMEGHASDVLLFRPEIQQLGRRRGERSFGTGSDPDAPAIARILDGIKAAETDEDKADAGKEGIKREAAALKERTPMTELKSIKDRLRRKLRAALKDAEKVTSDK
jgi:hypothetical protein